MGWKEVKLIGERCIMKAKLRKTGKKRKRRMKLTRAKINVMLKRRRKTRRKSKSRRNLKLARTSRTNRKEKQKRQRRKLQRKENPKVERGAKLCQSKKMKRRTISPKKLKDYEKGNEKDPKYKDYEKSKDPANPKFKDYEKGKGGPGEAPPPSSKAEDMEREGAKQRTEGLGLMTRRTHNHVYTLVF